MKTILAAVALIFALCLSAAAADTNRVEYASIRWQGRENTYVVLPSGNVKFIWEKLKAYPKPDKVDDRSYYLTVAINLLSKEGFKVVGWQNDDVLMERPAKTGK